MLLYDNPQPYDTDRYTYDGATLKPLGMGFDVFRRERPLLTAMHPQDVPKGFLATPTIRF